MAQKISVSLPLVCPYCDEEAYQKKNSTRVKTPHNIYTLRECIMGHTFYSVEGIPENQAEIEDEVKQIRSNRRKHRTMHQNEGM